MDRGLDKIYRLLWPMRPGDSGAIERFHHLTMEFTRLISSCEPLRRLGERGVVRILELGSGTGIAGVALSKALHGMGIGVDIDFTDIREGDLDAVEEWLETAGLKGIRHRRYVLDSRSIPKKLGGEEYDLVLFFGSPLPHLDVFEYILTVAGISQVLRRDGVYMVEQYNLGWELLRRRGFQEILLENRLGEGEALISIYTGYDEYRGVQERSYYRIPGMEYIGRMRSRLWDIASIIGINWIFFRNVEIRSFRDIREARAIISWDTRKEKPGWEELYNTLPSQE